MHNHGSHWQRCDLPVKTVIAVSRVLGQWNTGQPRFRTVFVARRFRVTPPLPLTACREVEK